MAVSRSARIDRLVQLQMLANAAWGQAHHFANGNFYRCIIHIACAERIAINRKRLANTDRIAQLDGAFARHPGSDHVFGQIPCRICGRAVDFCRVFTRKRAATVWCSTAIGIHDNFAARKAGIAIRPTDDKNTRRVHVPRSAFVDPAVRQDFTNIGLHNRANIRAGLILGRVLCRQNDG